jgi:hypothetical protein
MYLNQSECSFFRFLLMTSFIDSLAASEKTAVVIDIGHAYTK